MQRAWEPQSTSLNHIVQFENQQTGEHEFLLTARISDLWLEPNPVHSDFSSFPKVYSWEASWGWKAGVWALGHLLPAFKSPL